MPTPKLCLLPTLEKTSHEASTNFRTINDLKKILGL